MAHSALWQKQQSLQPPATVVSIFELPSYQAFLGLSTATVRVSHRGGHADGQTAEGQEQQWQCLWGGRIAPSEMPAAGVAAAHLGGGAKTQHALLVCIAKGRLGKVRGACFGNWNHKLSDSGEVVC